MKAYILISLLLISPIAVASGQNDVGTVTSMTVGATWMRVQTTSMSNSEGCISNTYFRLDFADDFDKTMYSAILAANAARQEIYFLLDGCSGDYPKISHIYFP